MAMPELGADHVTIGVSMLSDLAAFPSLPRYEKGQWKTNLREYADANPHFIWEDWKAPTTKSEANVLKKVAKASPGTIAQEENRVNSKEDLLADGVLDKLNEEDLVTRVNLAEGLRRFAQCEEDSKRFIQSLQRELA
jgi:transaldolase